jgi:hypothetical protein
MATTRHSIVNRRRVRVTAWSRLCPRPAKVGRDSASEIVSTQSLRMKDPSLYEASSAYCVWKHGKTNGHNLLSFSSQATIPTTGPSSFPQQRQAEPARRWGILPQTPWDLSLWRQDSGPARASARPRGIPAPEPALGSHPCVALPSAQVTVSISEKKCYANAK